MTRFDDPKTLIVMRLANMVWVHPNQILSKCEHCGEVVGIYPSGQEVLAHHPNINVVCLECGPKSNIYQMAPGAGPEEARQTVPGPAA